MKPSAMVRIDAKQYQAMAKPKRNKYHAEPMVLDGIRFASKKEAAYYAALKIREKAGEVANVELQKRYALKGPNGELLATYLADFDFDDLVEKRHRTIDVKGVQTAVFRMKKRMMWAMLRIDVEVV